MQGSRHHLLTGAGLTQQQHGKLSCHSSASHAQGASQSAIATGQFVEHLRLGNRRTGRRNGTGEVAVARHLKGLEKKLAFGGLSAPNLALHQTRDELHRAAAQQITAVQAQQRLARHLQQTAGLIVSGQQLPVKAQRQQPMPGGTEILPAAVEGQHQVFGVADTE
ncbi:hypothetical protein D3C78_636310 [compost metagenome]